MKNITIKLCKDIWCPGRASKQGPLCCGPRAVPLFRPLATYFVWVRNLVVPWRSFSLQPDSCQHPKEEWVWWCKAAVTDFIELVTVIAYLETCLSG